MRWTIEADIDYSGGFIFAIERKIDIVPQREQLVLRQLGVMLDCLTDLSVLVHWLRRQVLLVRMEALETWLQRCKVLGVTHERYSRLGLTGLETLLPARMPPAQALETGERHWRHSDSAFGGNVVHELNDNMEGVSEVQCDPIMLEKTFESSVAQLTVTLPSYVCVPMVTAPKLTNKELRQQAF